MVDQNTSMALPVQIVKDDERDLIKAAQRDPTAFTQLYQRYVHRIYRYLHCRLGNSIDAEEVTSQTFLTALESLHKYRHRGSFSAWLFTIARSRLMDHYRKQKKQVSLENPEAFPSGQNILQQVLEKERIATLKSKIDDLPEDTRELLQLRYVSELPFAEIAALLERSEGAVKKSLYRTVARLSAEMEEAHE